MGQVDFVCANIFAAIVAWVAADITMKYREPWRRALATLAGFPIIVSVVVILLGSVGRLSALSATLLVGTVASTVLTIRWWIVKTQTSIAPPTTYPGEPYETEHFIRSLSLAFMGGFAGLWLVLSCSKTSFVADDLAYHAPAVAHWIVDGRISLAPFNYHAYFPFNAEVLSLWFMLPFHADGSAGLSGFYWGTLMVGAAISLIIAQGHTRPTGMIVGGLLLSSPVLFGAAQTFSAVDLAAPALVVAAIALSKPSRDRQTVGEDLVDAAYTGLLAGFAAGCKISFVPVVPILLLWQVWGLRRQYHAHMRVWIAAIFALCSTVTGAYWYVRAWLLTGNPMFPAAFGPFGGPFGAAEQSHTKLIRWIIASPTDLAFGFH